MNDAVKDATDSATIIAVFTFRRQNEGATDASVTACMDNINRSNQNILDNADNVFAENMGLMEDLRSSYNLKTVVGNIIEAGITRLNSKITSFTTSAILNI